MTAFPAAELWLPEGYHKGLVTIVVPAKDEEAGIGKMLDSLPVETLHVMGYQTEVVVLDGHSRDRTRQIARRYGAAVIADRNEGKGGAFRDARPQFHGAYVVVLDADGTYAPDAIPRILDPLAWGEADVVMGDRSPRPGAMSRSHRAGNALLSLSARLLFGGPCPDLCTGLWAFQGNALRALPLRSRGFELEAEMFATSSRLGMRVRHVGVDYLPRAGKSKLSATRDAARIVWCLLRSRFSRLALDDAAPEAPALRIAGSVAR